MVFIIGGVFIFGLIVLVLIERRRRRFSLSDQEFFAETWQKIELMEPRYAVLEADKLLDRALGKLGFAGSLGDKLKKAEALLSDRNGVWYAHKMRNRLAHELEFHATDHEARRALSCFLQALKDLGGLL
ncbi:MAG: hypothetical protein UY05_C0038G0002 [Candidatus Peregrinibacteria bacterium GW2011_GWA2_47_7]|nr:MAG: hypothetical protein UY05_C0038G0002 [Candidatus Peregrinibacteria bacterium GW2011_GWA2_47_7]